MPAHVSTRRRRGGCSLAVRGEIDVASAGDFSATLRELVEHGQGEVEVDLCHLEFIDSHGLHLLLDAQRRLTRQGRRLRVRCSPGSVRRAFELARLLETFGIEERAGRSLG